MSGHPLPELTNTDPDGELSTAVRRHADALYDRVVELRRAIHRRPELANEEFETARLVAGVLEEAGFEVHRGIAGTGVVGLMSGDHPGPSVMLRAAMDALPIHESTGLSFASDHPGVMHACGHDAHTASLLGASLILGRMRERLHGTVRLLFQPAEERVPGGALPMIKAGALRPIGDFPAAEVAFGQHVQPELPVGSIGVRAGMYMASADELHVTLRGEAGHAAAPHMLRADVVVAAAQVVTALQSVISRNCPPGVPSILTIGRLIADGATNVIPETAQLEGTFRAMNETWRFRAHDLIVRTIEQTARAFGAEAEVEVRVGYPALHNHEMPTSFVQRAATRYVGSDNVVELDPWYAAEDFAWYLQEVPGSFFRLGTGNRAAGIIHPVHSPQFTIDEEALRVGSGFMAYLALAYPTSLPARP
ncbi:MAG: M20 metallopeptidase family protein [Bacteroidota bacterium]